MSEPTTKKKSSPASPSSTTTGNEADPARVYRGQASFDHDLYKLELGTFQRNKAFLPGEQPDFENIEHVHHFHSVDSGGKKQTRSTAIGGHFHEMIVVKPASGGSPALLRCGPAMREVVAKVRGKRIRKIIPVVVYQDKDEKGNAVPNGETVLDQHSHEVTYIRSNKIEMRKANAEAINVIAREANLTAPIAGVVG